MKNKRESWRIHLEATSLMRAGSAEPVAAISLQRVITGTPTAPNPVATVLAMSATSALNIGL